MRETAFDRRLELEFVTAEVLILNLNFIGAAYPSKTTADHWPPVAPIVNT
jgi:hypothetical protein